MKIAVVHSFYTAGKPSGENALVRDQVRALGAAGHTVELFAAHTDELARDPLYPLRAAARVASGRGNSPLARLREFAPDVVHVHNLFPNFGRSWVRHWVGPLVATLHNYRPMCAAATLYRAGAVCTSCPDGDPGRPCDTAATAAPGPRRCHWRGPDATALLGTRCWPARTGSS